nr:probable beta-D-xylosidase 5 [Ipomoea batatas]
MSIYAGKPCKNTTILQGLQKNFAGVTYEPGCKNPVCQDSSLIEAAAKAAATGDTVVVVVGLDQSIEQEGLDRDNLKLPGFQEKLVTDVVSATNNASVILVVMSSSPIDIAFAKNNSRIGAILWVGYPGQDGGEAIAQVIFGHYNPGGRSPFTWYPQEYADKVAMTDMNMRANATRKFPGRTYRFYNGESIYPFGHGLSYTTFSKFITSAPSTIIIKPSTANNKIRDTALPSQALNISSIECQSLEFEIVVGVKNTGKIDGSHVVLVFWEPKSAQGVLTGAPNVQLVGFERVAIKKGVTESVTMKLDVCRDFSLADGDGNRKVVTGLHSIVVGAPSERQVRHYFNIRLAGQEILI